MPNRTVGRRPLRAAAPFVFLALIAVFAGGRGASADAACGVPLGGIGAGKIDLLPDGSFARATLNGNERAPTGRLDGCFALLWTRVGGKTSAWALQTANPYGLPCAPAPQFRPASPGVAWTYVSSEAPVSAVVRGMSPLVPQDLRASSLPVLFLDVEVANTGRTPAEVSVAFSWEHLAGAAGRLPAASGAPALPFGLDAPGSMERYSNQAGLIGVRMDSGPIPDLPKERRDALNTRGAYLFAVDGRGLDAQITTAGWSLPGERTDRSDAARATHGAPRWWSTFAATGVVSGDEGMGAAPAGRLACLVAAKLTLRPGERRMVPFLFAWRTARRYLPDGNEYGRACVRGFDDVAEIAAYAADNRQNLRALTAEWAERIRLSTMPDWLTARVLGDAGAIATHTLWTRDSGGDEPEPGEPIFGLLNGARLSDVSFGASAQSLLSAIAPSLEWSAIRRVLRHVAKEGTLPAYLGDLRSSLAEAGPPAAPSEMAAFVAAIACLYRSTGERSVAAAAMPALERILDRVGAPTSSQSVETAMANAVAHLAAADLASAAGAEARAIAWEKAGAEWAKAANRAFDAGVAVNVSDLAEVELLAGRLDKTGILEPAGKARLLQAALRLATTLGTAPWRPRGLWAVAAWLAAEGRTAEGLAAARATSDLLTRSGILCGAPGSLTAGDRPEDGRVDPAASASWSVMESLAGTRLDVPDRRLYLGPALAGRGGGEGRWPVFAPTFWGTVSRRRTDAGERLSFQLDRALPGLPSSREAPTVRLQSRSAAGVELREAVLPSVAPGAADVSARLGPAPLTGAAHADARGRLVFVFDPPLHVAVGQRLEFLVRPKAATQAP